MQPLKSALERYRIHPVAGFIMLIMPLILVFASIRLRESRDTRLFMRWLLAENHPVELLTFAALLLAGLLGCRLAKWMLPRGWPYALFYLLFGVGLIFVAMEEISWDQWFFFYETPEAIKIINKQHEMNFHNLPALHAPFEMLRVGFGLGGLLGIAGSFIKWVRPVGAPWPLAF